MRPRHPHPDANQAQIVRDLRALGFTVHDVSPLGGDALDLFVGGEVVYLGRFEWLQVELKANGGRLTAGEAAYLEKHPHPIWPVLVAYSTEDVLEWFGRIDNG